MQIRNFKLGETDLMLSNQRKPSSPTTIRQTRLNHRRAAPTAASTAETKPKPLIDSLQGTRRLGSLVAKARYLLYIESALAQYLPSELRGQCQVLNVFGPNLVLAVSSSALSTKLRFLAPELLHRLNQGCKQSAHEQRQALLSLRIKVRVGSQHSLPSQQAHGRIAAAVKQSRFASASTKQPAASLQPSSGKPSPSSASQRPTTLVTAAEAIAHPQLRQLWQRILRRQE